MRFILLSFVILSFFFGNTQSAFYSTESKKAIKFYEKAIVCFNNINPVNGKPDLIGAEELLLKSLQKDTLFWEAYSLLSNVKVEAGDLNNAIFYRKKMISISPTVPLIEYYYLSSMQMAIGKYEDCLKNALKYKQSPLAR